MDKKVSVITPCYNGENFIERFLNSILEQSYSNIELIIIDDGSKDKTKKKIEAYLSKYEKRGYELKYIYQENGGQASALNKGLEIFTGEYLTWPDSDDFLHRDSIKNRVEFLEKNLQYGMVRSSAYMYDEHDLENPIGFLGKEKEPIENIFRALITEEVGCTNGKYMVRKKAFIDSIPSKKIYESRAGQNWQMLLPIAYKYKCGYLDEELFNYVVRQNSHSHSDENISEEVTIKKMAGHEDILLNTIRTIIKNDKKEKKKYEELIRAKYIRRRMYVAIQYGNKKNLENNYKLLSEIDKITFKDKINYLRWRYSIINNFVKVVKKLKK